MPEEVAIFFQNNYPQLNYTSAAKILDLYPLEPSVSLHNAWFPSASRAYGEATFICPSIDILDSVQAKNSLTTQGWAYRYNVLSPENVALGYGVPHGWESWAIFGPDSIAGVGAAPPSYYGLDAAIVPVVMNYWISFVRTLDPNVLRYAGTPEWTTWDQDDGKQRLRFEIGDVGMETAPLNQTTRCALWKSLAAIMEQ